MREAARDQRQERTGGVLEELRCSSCWRKGAKGECAVAGVCGGVCEDCCAAYRAPAEHKFFRCGTNNEIPGLSDTSSDTGWSVQGGAVGCLTQRQSRWREESGVHWAAPVPGWAAAKMTAERRSGN